jgi:chemotaxis protein methyltransferase CheR
MTTTRTDVRLKRHVIDSTGLAYYVDKDAELIGHLQRRMAALGSADCSDYLSLLCDSGAGAAEHDALVEGLTIGETSFFRHQEVFDAMRDRVIPELIDRNQKQRRLRIWSAGCAIGAEPYSLSILLQQQFDARLADWEVTILGTDINREFLAQAQRGEFSDWAFRAVGDDVKLGCCARSGQAWRIKDEYRRGVQFQYHNLVQNRFPSLIDSLSAFDLVLCRNAMIYFEPAITCRLVRQFYDCLVDGGWFIVGPTEPSVELFRAFQTVNSPGAVLYRKSSRASASSVSPLPVPVDQARIAFKQRRAAEGDRAPAVAESQTVRKARRPRARHAGRTSGDSVSEVLAQVRQMLNAGSFEAAAERCRRLAVSERLNAAVHFYHALAVEQQGHQAEVEPALRRAIYLDRDFVLAHYHLGLVLERARDRHAAGRSFRNVLALLDRRDDAEFLPDADGLTVGSLRQLTRMHLEVLNHA